MNKYSSLKLNFLKDLPIDDFYQSYKFLRSSSPHGNISIFTKTENLNQTKSTIALPRKESTSIVSTCKTAMPSSRNFTDLLNKLDLVTSPKQQSLNERILSESDQIDCNLEEGSYFYIKIPIKNKPNPLRVTIKKSIGRVIIYASYLNQKPSASNYDNLFTADTFEIRSQDLFFKSEFLFLALRALAYTKLVISCLFGKKNFVFDNRLRKKDSDETDQRLKVRSVRNLQKRPESKNFIEENMKKRLASPEDRRKKSHEWLVRREKALVIKKQNLLDKREKAINFINRTKIRREQLKIQNQLKQALMVKNNQVKDWLTFLNILKVTQTIHEMRTLKRREKSRELTKKRKARTIQKFFRSTTKNLSIPQLSAMRAFCNIKFFHAHLSDFTVKKTRRFMFKVIRDTGENYKPRIKFAKFMKKIEMIQQRFRKYLGVKTERIRKMIIFWDECRTFQNRRSIKKKIMIHDLNISIYQRTVVLNNYYNDCIRNFYIALRDPGIFISQPSDRKVIRRLKVAFHYMPSLQKMKQMIEIAASIPDRVVVEDSPLPPGII